MKLEKCVSCKKYHKSVSSKTMWLCENCIQDFYKDYIGMLKEKAKKGINVKKEVNEFIDKMILPYENYDNKEVK